MNQWRKLVPGAFAGMTAPFGVHPLDSERAVTLLHAALRQGASFEEVVAECLSYLQSHGYQSEALDEEEERIRRFTPNPMRKLRMSRAWLVTLETEASDAPAVISVFKTQRSADSIREYMEQWYIDQFYDLQEKLVYATSRRDNPYPAEFERVDGVSWHGRITCGDNPLLVARIVRELRVLRSGHDSWSFAWQELPNPTFQRTASPPLN